MFNRMSAYVAAGCAAVLSIGVGAQGSVLMFDFGEVINPTGNNYNNITQNQLPIFNALDTTGAGTGIGLVTAGFNPGSNTTGTATTSGAAAIFASTATADNLFGHTVNFNQPAPLPLATLTFSGLDSSGLTAYDFVIFGSRMSVSDNRETQYVINGANSGTGYLDTANNTSNVAVVSGIIADAAGVITIDVSPGPNNNNSSGFYYLGAMQITTVPVPEPTALALLGLSGLLVAVRRH